jgi:hypothetical protein
MASDTLQGRSATLEVRLVRQSRGGFLRSQCVSTTVAVGQSTVHPIKRSRRRFHSLTGLYDSRPPERTRVTVKAARHEQAPESRATHCSRSCVSSPKHFPLGLHPNNGASDERTDTGLRPTMWRSQVAGSAGWSLAESRSIAWQRYESMQLTECIAQ